uniref:Thyroglobulin type-1 domain-containing protein n=1 Tax=Syphacia muris TaxID=451379 RepID=A0A0N5B0F2_9BILA
MLAVVALVAVVPSTEIVPQEIELENYAKQCRAPFDCWRTEPIGPDGLPLTLSGRLKRLDIGTSAVRGGKCRCRAGYCQYYQSPTETFFPCDEL